MPRLTFKADDVRRVVEHSIAAPEQGAGKAITAPGSAPAVLLVHDFGVYLMSNGHPRDLIDTHRSFVAYARGCDPIVDSDWRNTSRSLVGSDDFSITLPWAKELKALLDASVKNIELDFGTDSIAMVEC